MQLAKVSSKLGQFKDAHKFYRGGVHFQISLLKQIQVHSCIYPKAGAMQGASQN